MSDHFIVMAAGTGGHVMPGLAVAEEMRRRGWTVSWIWTTSGIENKLVTRQGIAIDRLDFAGMRGKGVWHFISGAVRFAKAMLAARRIFKRRRPTAVFGTGGYICVPAGIMARMLGVPLVLLNADSTLLMSNKLLVPFVDRVAFGFPGEYGKLGARASWTGNPVRAEVAGLPEPASRYASRTGPLHLLVVGGSLGAMVLNETVPKALALLPPEQRPVVVHQTGEHHVDGVRVAYATAGVEAEVLPFIDDMAGRYQDADLVICRAGAITVLELCAGGVPAILVPLKVSTTGHQEHNAQFMAQAGAAVHLPQDQFKPQQLARILASSERATLSAMGGLARVLAKPRATQSVADLIEGARR